MKIAFCYIPVLHKGYQDFLENVSKSVSTIFLIGEDILSEFSDLDYIKRKDSIRALDSQTMRKLIVAMGLFDDVFVLTKETIELFTRGASVYFAPDEDISFRVAEKYLKNKEIDFIPVFLRWNRKNVEFSRLISPDRTVSLALADREIMATTFQEGRRSWDWWRQVGAVIVDDSGSLLMIARNRHLPHEHMPYAFGDPRSIFKKGLHIELCTAEHAEAALIAEAAKNGIALNGKKIYVTDFPCPPCAKLIAHSGIKRCYFSNGYAMLDGEDILKDAGVEIIRVEMDC